MPHFQKKTQMTLEEEESETRMNAILRQKINDLQDQIHIKTDRYEKLKKERAQFKADRQNEIEKIKDEIQTMKDKNNDKLNDLIKKHNEDLNKKKRRKR